MADWDALLERLNAKLRTMPSRVCALCDTDLSGPGTASPLLDPGARDALDPWQAPWVCLDERGCDLRQIEQIRTSYPPWTLAALLCEVLAGSWTPERLMVEAGHG